MDLCCRAPPRQGCTGIQAPYLLDESQQVSSRTELQYEPHIVPRFVPVVKLQHVGAAKPVYNLVSFFSRDGAVQHSVS